MINFYLYEYGDLLIYMILWLPYLHLTFFARLDEFVEAKITILKDGSWSKPK